MRIKFWGVRGSIPTPGPTTLHYGGNTSCLEVRVGDQILILDAGTGLRLLGLQLLAEFGERPLDLTLLLTHTHWDHIQGLPFFMPVYQAQNRLRILGFEGARRGLDNVLSNQMESPYFPVGLREVPATVQIEELKETSFSLGAVQVEVCRAHHPGICVGYRLTVNGSSMAFFPDNELRQFDVPIMEPPTPASAGSTEFFDSATSGLLEFLRGVDVLIIDSQYTREEYREHKGWGHGCLNDVVALAVQCQAKKLFLFHHDPDHDDAKISQMVKDARELAAAHQGTVEIEAAREGLTVEVGKAEG
jgi:phosphoribosyl 1,2-cyclic phosphodiesterase